MIASRRMTRFIGQIPNKNDIQFKEFRKQNKNN